MNIDYLLIILPGILAVGVCGLILIIWQYMPFYKKKHRFMPTPHPDDSPTITEAFISVPVRNGKDPYHKNIHALLDQKAIPLAQLRATVNTQGPIPSPQDPLMVLHLVATALRPYQGYELVQTLSSVGFHYGEMNIFHYHAQQNANNQRLFSLASALEPGTFDLNHIGEISCPGLCLFMGPNRIIHAPDHFELMLEIAQLLIQDLGGTLCDSQHNPLTSEVLIDYRSQLRAHEQNEIYCY